MVTRPSSYGMPKPLPVASYPFQDFYQQQQQQETLPVPPFVSMANANESMALQTTSVSGQQQQLQSQNYGAIAKHFALIFESLKGSLISANSTSNWAAGASLLPPHQHQLQLQQQLMSGPAHSYLSNQFALQNQPNLLTNDASLQDKIHSWTEQANNNDNKNNC